MHVRSSRLSAGLNITVWKAPRGENGVGSGFAGRQFSFQQNGRSIPALNIDTVGSLIGSECPSGHFTPQCCQRTVSPLRAAQPHALDTGFIADHRSEEHTSELQSPCNLVCRLLLEKKT